jgi:hypothetical protein
MMTAPTVAARRGDGRQRPDGAHRSPSWQVTARNRGRIAGGIALLAISAVLAVLVYGNLGNRTPVLAAAREIRAGAVIEEGDLMVVGVAAEPRVATVPESRTSDVVGRRAAVGLAPGGLIAPESVRTGPVVPPGNTLIGAVVRPGQYPLGLDAGDSVLVLVAAGGIAERRFDAVQALIVSVSESSGPDGTAISLAVPEADAGRLARAGADGGLILMQPVP